MPHYSLTAEAGVFALAGQGANQAEQGNFTLAGQDATFLRGHVLKAMPGIFSLTGSPSLLFADNEADSFMFYDDVTEWTTTAGTARPYILRGAVQTGDMLSGSPFSEVLTEGQKCFASVRDGLRHEWFTARFSAPNMLFPMTVLRSSNGGSEVDWPATGRRIVQLRNAPAKVQTRLRRQTGEDGAIRRSVVTGDTVTLAAGTSVVLIQPSPGTIATLTVTLPPSPENLDIVQFVTTETVTVLTVNGAGGDSTWPAGTYTLVRGTAYRYRASNTTWYQMYNA